MLERAARTLDAPRETCVHLLAVCRGPLYICMSSSELHTLYRAFTDAGGHWSTFVIWAKHHFTLGRADYQRQYEPIRQARTRVTDHGSLSIPSPSSCGCGTSGSTRIDGVTTTSAQNWPEKIARPAGYFTTGNCICYAHVSGRWRPLTMAKSSAPKPLKHILITATFSSLFVLACHAQDPPTRVADLNYLTGNVSIQPAGADDWTPAVVNRPFTTGDALWADADTRAELHLNNAVLRVGPQSSIGFINLDDHFAQIRFTQGELFLRVRHLGDDDSFEVDTPNAAVTILREGEYRFNSDPDGGTTWAVVRHGEAEVTGGGQAFSLRAGNSAQLSGTDQLSYDVGTVPPPDPFEGWAEDRDNREGRSPSARYLPPDVIGYQELDNNGDWRDTPGYGPVWYPRVAAGWAPYHDGHWAWVEPWGWSWVDDAPWGFAPSHYGRWAYANGGWGWVPGPMAIVAGRPPVTGVVYAPALVAFFGGGGFGVSLSIGGPAVGWVPLGPGEVYAPSYHVSQNYFRTMNVSSTTIVKTVNITNVYNNVYVNKTVTNVTVNEHFANMAAPNAVTAMPQGAFASGRPVKQGGIFVPKAQIAQVQTAHFTVAPSVAPVKQALAPTAGARPAPRPPARAMAMQVVAKKTPPPPPIPFAAKQAALQQNAGKPLNVQAIRQSLPPARVTAAAPAVRVAPPSHPVTPQVHTAPPAPPAKAPATQANRPPAATPPPNRPPAVTPPARPAPETTPRPESRPPAVTPPANRPPAEKPAARSAPETTPRPESRPPAATPPANRPPAEKPPARPAPETTPRPESRPPAATPPPNRPPAEKPPARSAPETTPRPESRPPAATPPARPAPEARPAQPPPPKPAAKPTQKPKKDTEKEKDKQ